MKPDFDPSELNETGMNKKYQCPMKCEGEKLYEKPGSCPVCNMKLVQAGTETHDHHHH
jgi:hypothetical protein